MGKVRVGAPWILRASRRWSGRTPPLPPPSFDRADAFPVMPYHDSDDLPRRAPASLVFPAGPPQDLPTPVRTYEDGGAVIWDEHQGPGTYEDGWDRLAVEERRDQIVVIFSEGRIDPTVKISMRASSVRGFAYA